MPRFLSRILAKITEIRKPTKYNSHELCDSGRIPQMAIALEYPAKQKGHFGSIKITREDITSQFPFLAGVCCLQFKNFDL